jgi:hypothetical protein
MSLSSDHVCPHCNARPNEREIADGWCDACGKRFPSWIAMSSSPATSPTTSKAPTGSGPRFALWAVGAIAVSGLLAVAAALASAG